MAHGFASRGWFSVLGLSVLALAGCSSGSIGSNTMPPGSTLGTSSYKSAHFTIKIPPKRKNRAYRPQYVSAGTASMTVAVQGGASSTFNLTPASAGCTVDGSTGYTTCREAMSIPSGEQTLTVILYNLENGKGSPLATATTSVNVANKSFTEIPITLGGIVAAVQVLIGGNLSASVPMGTPTSVPVTVEAYDASGSLIVPPGNYSSPITLTADTNGTTSFSFPGSSARSGRGIDKERYTEKEKILNPHDTTTLIAPGAIATLYYNGGVIPSSSAITPTVNGTIQRRGAAMLVGTANITSYNVPGNSFGSEGITAGADGALWFTECSANAIGRITTSGEITQYPTPTLGSAPDLITAGPDGALWFAEYKANNIGRITTAGAITEYHIPTPGAAPYGITTGADGALWFTENCGNNIGRITTSGAITEYPIPPNDGSGPFMIAAGSDGALWFTEIGSGTIGRITTSGTVTNDYPAPGGFITAGPDNALWFTTWTGQSSIGRITTSGAVTYFLVPDPATFRGITTGPDGALWFVGADISNRGDIGRVTTAGQVTEYPTAFGGEFNVASGPDGALWFVDCTEGNNVNRMPL